MRNRGRIPPPDVTRRGQRPRYGTWDDPGIALPGFPAPSANAEKNKRRGRVDITFTKWVTASPHMEGVTGGDVPGEFVGKIFDDRSANGAETCYLAAPNCGRVIRLEVLYEVQAGDRSFVALIRGGTSGDTGAAHSWMAPSVRVEDRRAGACGIPDNAPCLAHRLRLRRRTRGQGVFPGHDSH